MMNPHLPLGAPASPRRFWSRLSWNSPARRRRSQAFLAALGLVLMALLAPDLAKGGVVINEIMYHPVSTNVLEEWFELYNPAVTNVNLSGWQMTKGVHFAF